MDLEKALEDYQENPFDLLGETLSGGSAQDIEWSTLDDAWFEVIPERALGRHCWLPRKLLSAMLGLTSVDAYDNVFRKHGCEDGELLKALLQGDGARAISIAQKQHIRENYATGCLLLALGLEPEVFEAVLDCCEPVEYAGLISEDRALDAVGEVSLPRYANAYLVSSLLCIACYYATAEHVRILLKHGWSLNCDSERSRRARSRFIDHQWYDDPDIPETEEQDARLPVPPRLYGTERHLCDGEHVLHLNVRTGFYSEDDCMEIALREPSPLAAALLAGSRDTVELLLEQPGVRLRDPSVLRAMQLDTRFIANLSGYLVARDMVLKALFEE